MKILLIVQQCGSEHPWYHQPVSGEGSTERVIIVWIHTKKTQTLVTVKGAECSYLFITSVTPLLCFYFNILTNVQSCIQNI